MLTKPIKVHPWEVYDLIAKSKRPREVKNYGHIVVIDGVQYLPSTDVPRTSPNLDVEEPC